MKKTLEPQTKGEYGMTPFEIITESTILSKDDVDSLIPLTEELQETFKRAQSFRTRTEMEVSVLDDVRHPTHDSKYWQAVREQNVMFTEMVFLSYEYRKNAIEIKQLENKIQKEEDELERELLKIERERKRFISKGHEKVAKDRIREITEWSKIKEREALHMSEESLKDVGNHQLLSYTQRWLRQSIIAGDSGSPAEKQNLQGQLNSGLRMCAENGIINKALEIVPLEVRQNISKKFLIKS